MPKLTQRSPARATVKMGISHVLWRIIVADLPWIFKKIQRLSCCYFYLHLVIHGKCFLAFIGALVVLVPRWPNPDLLFDVYDVKIGPAVWAVGLP